jgi:hypothetical protein
MHLELLTEDKWATKAATAGDDDINDRPIDESSLRLVSNSTASASSRFSRRQNRKKSRSSGGRIDANTPTVVAVRPPPSNIQLPLSVSFRGIAGLGHRLFRQSNTYHLAKGLYLNELTIDWGWCYYTKEGNDGNPPNATGQADIASYLFGVDQNGNTVLPIPRQQPTSQPQLPLVSFPFIKAIQWKNDELIQRRQRKPITVEFVNEVTHYNERQYSLAKAIRQHPRFYGKDRSDLEMYQTLVQRFQERHPRVQHWKDKFEFDTHTVIGLHIRQGNGEMGDFQNKGRGIQGVIEEQWIANLAGLLVNFTAGMEDPTEWKPPLIFLATDSSNATQMVAQLHQHLEQVAGSLHVATSIPKVVTIQQPRVPPGKGVSYQYMFDSTASCLEGWTAQMTDMILLAESDVVVAGQYSSFTQTIPLSFQFTKATAMKARDLKNNSPTSRNENSKKLYPSSGLFCNVGALATVMECFDDFGEWMIGKSSFPLVGDPNSQKQDCKNLITMPVHTMILPDMLKRKLQALPVDIVSLV